MTQEINKVNELIFNCKSGSFSGIQQDGVLQIKGIRYAISKRYERPLPYVYEAGIHQMHRNAPFAVQEPSNTESILQGTFYEKFPQEESSQYLSITRPLKIIDEQKLPVMVWFHGGSYRNGGCDGPSYDRTLLVRENNLIVVGVNYRLGVLGFVKDQDGNFANNGLLDGIAGLKWIKENISAFGGDPDNITLFGQSAGADLIRNIMISEGTDKLYRRVILQSDPIGAMENRQAMDEQVLEELNRVPLDLSTKELLAVQNQIESHVQEKGNAKFLIFAPHYGVYPLPKKKDIPKRLAEIATSHDLLIGSTTREAAAVIGVSEKLSKADRLLLTKPMLERFLHKKGNAIFIKPAFKLAKEYAKAGGKTFHYVFDWMDGKHELGAIHISDLLPLFGLGQAEGWPIAMGYSKEQVERLGKPMRKVWADFAKTGEITNYQIPGMLTIQKI
ncbi:MAG: carboxylesterase family protein [Lactobacillus crispatus]|nr:carboxylesterase family protein [Lactobacillus crispatus]